MLGLRQEPHMCIADKNVLRTVVRLAQAALVKGIASFTALTQSRRSMQVEHTCIIPSSYVKRSRPLAIVQPNTGNCRLDQEYLNTTTERECC